MTDASVNGSTISEEDLKQKLEQTTKELKDMTKQMQDELRMLVVESEKLRFEAKSSLHDRIAVLSAGSIAAVVSIASLWGSRHPSPIESQSFKLAFAISLFGAWLALVCALLHNFFLNRARDRQTRAYRAAFSSNMAMISMIRAEEKEKIESAKTTHRRENRNMEQGLAIAKSTERKAEFFGLAALIFFGLTYLAAILTLIYFVQI